MRQLNSITGHRPLRLICDEMLIRLSRWLRAAGYDCAVLPDGSHDREIMQLARDESRLVLTRDRQFLCFRDAEEYVLFMEVQTIDEQAKLLSEQLGVDWLLSPFSRCMMCNEELIEGTVEQRAGLTVRLQPEEPLRYCPSCERLYWNGGHVHRMEKKLLEWKEKWQK